jgi:hypothetical protein
MLDPHQFRTSRDPLLLWDNMISIYSIRDFTDHRDRLPAVSGLADIISQSTGEEYLLGLWTSRLPAQLLWAVKGPWKPFRQGERSPLPSWSWASIAPARKIDMPRQASSRARLLKHTTQGFKPTLHLSGRLRSLTEGLQRLDVWPAESEQGFPGSEISNLENDPNPHWAIHAERRCVLVCLSWKRPIFIFLDQELPDSYGNLVCFEISYLGFLVLRPLSEEGVYERVGCAPWHREPGFFADSPSVDLKLV